MKIPSPIKGENRKHTSIRSACRSSISRDYAPGCSAIGRPNHIDYILAAIGNVGGVDVTVVLIDNHIAFDVDSIGLAQSSNWCDGTEGLAPVSGLHEKQTKAAGRIG